jgi:hypothetical protein
MKREKETTSTQLVTCNKSLEFMFLRTNRTKNLTLDNLTLECI